MTNPFQSADELLNLFEIGEGSQYYDPVKFTDSKVGFSVKRDYPDTIRYKPTFKADGTPNNVATIWVGYTHPEETKRDIDFNRVPIRIRVANMNIFRIRHFDYDYNNPDCPTEDSVEQSKLTPTPIELEYNNEFYYNHDNEHFINDSGDVLTGNEILDKAFKEHCETVHLIKGFNLRFKLYAKAKGYGLLGLFITFSKFILIKLFGRTLENQDTYSTLVGGYKKANFKQLNEDSLNVFGYKASKPVIILFCALVSLISFIRYSFDISGGYLSYIASNNTKSFSHGILSLWVLDAVVPYMIFFLVNFLIKLRYSIMTLTIKWK